MSHGHAAWADPQDIEEGEPVTLEGAETEPLGRLALQYSGTFSHVRLDDQTSDLLEQGPTFKLGVGGDFQVSVNPNYDSGSAASHDSGFVLNDLKYKVREQTNYLPSISVDVFASVLFGAGAKTNAYAIRGIAEKSLGPTDVAPRLYLNLTDYHLAIPGIGDRKDQLQLVAGGSALLSNTDAIVADVVHGNAQQVRNSETFIELGWSRDLPSDWTCQLGIGKQVAGQATGLRVFFAIEKELQLF